MKVCFPSCLLLVLLPPLWLSRLFPPVSHSQSALSAWTLVLPSVFVRVSVYTPSCSSLGYFFWLPTYSQLLMVLLLFKKCSLHFWTLINLNRWSVKVWFYWSLSTPPFVTHNCLNASLCASVCLNDFSCVLHPSGTLYVRSLWLHLSCYALCMMCLLEIWI